MAASYLHKPGTPGGHCIEPCDHETCNEERYEAKQLCKLCGKPIGYEVDYHYVFWAAAPDDGWYEHLNCAEIKRINKLMSSDKLQIICIAPITIEGVSDDLEDTLECEPGDRFNNVFLEDNGTYYVNQGIEAYWIPPEIFDKHFKVL